MTHTAAEVTWLTSVLKYLHFPQPHTLVLFCDNISALHTINLVFHAKSKHIELDYHFVRERGALGLLITQYIPTSSQVVDIFTKPISEATIALYRPKLRLQPQLCLRNILITPAHPIIRKSILRLLWSDKVVRSYEVESNLSSYQERIYLGG
ncbi:hypothetical protein M9H77_35281 [Catharanthus roseus]|uniref:Uncharacterized protein n=1 Tax=Catharanthus roseus TaxID=4058 RepID=A0ACB9ZPT7_CATRO|nr:hypothetical protein M9H77_35281 [Catharanthus roseus]